MHNTNGHSTVEDRGRVEDQSICRQSLALSNSAV